MLQFPAEVTVLSQLAKSLCVVCHTLPPTPASHLHHAGHRGDSSSQSCTSFSPSAGLKVETGLSNCNKWEQEGPNLTIFEPCNGAGLVLKSTDLWEPPSLQRWESWASLEAGSHDHFTVCWFFGVGALSSLCLQGMVKPRARKEGLQVKLDVAPSTSSDEWLCCSLCFPFPTSQGFVEL